MSAKVGRIYLGRLEFNDNVGSRLEERDPHESRRRATDVRKSDQIVNYCSSKDKILPAGSLNHAMVGPSPPLAMPFLSVLSSGWL